MRKYLLPVLILWACNPDKNKPVDASKPRFDTSVSSEMFFKNVRKIFYSLTTDQTGREQFRMRAGTDNESAGLNLCIVADWKNDRAYILFEPSPVLGDTVQVRRTDTQEIFTYVPGPIDNHYTFVSQIYACIQSEIALEAKVGQSWQDAFPSTLKRENFRKTLVDFYRLVGAL